MQLADGNNFAGTHLLFFLFFCSPLFRLGRFVNRGVKVPTDAQEVVDLEVMFHVAPFLPHSSSKDDQQLHKKRHLGNDIVVVIYKGKEDRHDLLFFALPELTRAQMVQPKYHRMSSSRRLGLFCVFVSSLL